MTQPADTVLCGRGGNSVLCGMQIEGLIACTSQVERLLISVVCGRTVAGFAQVDNSTHSASAHVLAAACMHHDHASR